MNEENYGNADVSFFQPQPEDAVLHTDGHHVSAAGGHRVQVLRAEPGRAEQNKQAQSRH